MSSVRVIRKMDKLGRLCIPIDFREMFRLSSDDDIEISICGDHIGIKKYEPGCIFCGETEDVFQLGDKNICKRCGRLIGGRVGQ